MNGDWKYEAIISERRLRTLGRKWPKLAFHETQGLICARFQISSAEVSSFSFQINFTRETVMHCNLRKKKWQTNWLIMKEKNNLSMTYFIDFLFNQEILKYCSI